MPDWNLIKTQYEILGAGVNELCDKHHVTVERLNHAIEAGSWAQRPVVVDDDVNAALNDAMTAMHIHHQAEMIPRYISIETRFMNKVENMIDNMIDMQDAKRAAEALAIIRPTIMVAAQNEGANTGSNKIIIVNKFDVPQPGDKDYVAPNAVILGDHARQNNGITEAVDYRCIEIDLPGPDDLN